MQPDLWIMLGIETESQECLDRGPVHLPVFSLRSFRYFYRVWFSLGSRLCTRQFKLVVLISLYLHDLYAVRKREIVL
jgi:hypothetical protein